MIISTETIWTIPCVLAVFWIFCQNQFSDFWISLLKLASIQTNTHTALKFIYLGFYVAFNTVQVISRWVVGRAEETSTYSSLGFCTVNCRPTASNYQLSHMRPCRESNPGLRDGRRECYHSATVAPYSLKRSTSKSEEGARHEVWFCILY